MREREIIKRGTDDWWVWVAMLKAAEQDRKRLNLAPDSAVEIDVEKCNQFLDSVNRNPFKKIWLLLTIGDLQPADRDKIGPEIIIKDKNDPELS